MEIKVLYEDKDIIVALKPSCMPSQPDKTGDIDMLTKLSGVCGSEVFVINRLDRPVSGLMLFGKNQETTKNLSAQIQKKKVIKKYHAVLCGKPKEDKGEFVDYLLKSQKDNMSKVVQRGCKNAKEAKLSYEVVSYLKIDSTEELTLVGINLETGRHHQIRVQFSSRGLPLWGDVKYNNDFRKKRIKSDIGLCSSSISFFHPKTNKNMYFSVVPEGGIFDDFKRG